MTRLFACIRFENSAFRKPITSGLPVTAVIPQNLNSHVAGTHGHLLHQDDIVSYRDRQLICFGEWISFNLYYYLTSKNTVPFGYLAKETQLMKLQSLIVC